MFLIGKNINLRTVKIDDAKYIFDMRQDDTRNKYLSKVTGTVKNQENWIKKYKQRESKKKEFYFVIESKNRNKLGLVRMYDFRSNSFCWGSWLIEDNAPKTTAIESALQIYEFGFYTLGFQKSHFDVRKENNKIIAFHKRFGAKIIDENQLDYFFTFKKSDYEIIKEKYKRYL